MAKKSPEKTQAMRLLDTAGLSYSVREVGSDEALSGVEVASRLGLDPAGVFKTLVTESKEGHNFVFMVPVAETLDLKKAAQAVGQKSLAMIPQAQLKPKTGYVHGGCSPLGMKHPFPTVIDESAILFDTISFSAGKIGLQLVMNPEDLASFVPATFADICQIS